MTSRTDPLPPPSKAFTLTAVSVSYSKPAAASSYFNPCSAGSPSKILRRVSFSAYPAEILAVVGPSGSGKSTLLDILAARTTPTVGSVLLNGTPISPSTYRKLSVFLPQDDVVFLPLLTLRETFAFAARLLTPYPTPIVESLIFELGLTHIQPEQLAGALSGGERRRVMIGLALLHDPAVLILDEPISGLDSSSAFNILQILQSLAAAHGRTVVVTLHQPSFKILSVITRILLLSRGTLIHHGTLSSLSHFIRSNGFTIPPQLNPLEYSMELLTELLEFTDHAVTPLPIPEIPLLPPRYRTSRMNEIAMLSGRFWKVIYRTRQLLVANTVEALIVGLVLGTLYVDIGLGKQGILKRFGFFAFTLTFLLSSTTETLPVFINERSIVLQEASTGMYRLSSHLIANTLIFVPYLLIIALIYSFSVYFLVDLCRSWSAFGYFVLVIWVVVLMANSFVLFLSSLAPNCIAGTSLVTVILAAFFLFSGYFIAGERMPRFWLWMHFASMYKYALDALLLNEYSCIYTKCLMWFEENKTCMVTGGDVLKQRGLKEEHRWTNVYVLICFFLIYRVLWWLVLMRRVSRTK